MQLYQNLCFDSNITAEAKDLCQSGLAIFFEETSDDLKYRVLSEYVTLSRSGEIFCTCGNCPCVHMAAALSTATDSGRLQQYIEKNASLLGTEVQTALSNSIRGVQTIHLGYILRLSSTGDLSLALNIGIERMYALRSIPRFMNDYVSDAEHAVCDKFRYGPETMCFSREDELFLELLSHHLECGVRSDDCRPQYQANGEGRFINLDGALLYDVLHCLENRSFVFITNDSKQSQIGIREADLNLEFDIQLETSHLNISAKGFQRMEIITENFRYISLDRQLFRLSRQKARLCKTLFQGGGVMAFPAQTMENVLNTLLPVISSIGKVNAAPNLSSRLEHYPLVIKTYLDLVNTNVEARVEFHYGDKILSPFNHQIQADNASQSINQVRKILLRDGNREAVVMNFFANAGFSMYDGHICLKRSKDILAFCTQGVGELGKLTEVYASTSFEKIKPRKPHLRASLQMHSGHLVLALLEESRKLPEEAAVLEAISKQQQYVRLKSGEFLDIRDYGDLAPVASEIIMAAESDHPEINRESAELHFGSYRAAYMMQMLNLTGIEITADEEVQNVIDTIGVEDTSLQKYIPTKLQKKLAAYQLRGTNWILSVYQAKMGGILADEMGLGKTVQIIAALSAAKHKDGSHTSLIVTPTSLTYHWLAELRRFDEKLNVRVVTGLREQRQEIIAKVKEDPEVDVVLTSYPLLRRDIDLIRDIAFRFVVLDEAQSVKNAQSQGAAAAKELQADVRIALTGTPMENHTGELWSIFDFILPGYLGTQVGFLRRYGSGQNASELHARIQPFLIRRLKKDVLTDLPKKNEHYLYAAMTAEQRRIYDQLLQNLRVHIDKVLSEGNPSRSRMQVLSLLLKLRQVCCHPKLIYNDYDGTSGKLELLVQVVQSAIENQHRILVFSQFVGMLQIIRKRLNCEGIPCLYLDGETKAEQRQQMCDSFNAGEGKVFLISLKAGGTGLNLIGADLVIHYDPWWNPQAEDQATDRAHRIGQNHEVDVVRLITHDSIEEKVTELSAKKRDLFEKVIIAGETDLYSLTDEDIRALFSMETT